MSVHGVQKFHCGSKITFTPLFFYGLSNDLKAIIELISGQELQTFPCDRHIVFLPFMVIFIFQKFLGKQKSFYSNILKCFKHLLNIKMELNLSGLNLSLYYLQQDTENYVLASLILCWPKFFGNCRRASYSRIHILTLALSKFQEFCISSFK